MRKIVLGILLLTIPILVLSSQQEDRGMDYEKFAAKYRGNQKMDPVKRDQRRQIFQRNFQKFLEQSKDNPSLGVSHFMDWTPQQLREFFNLKRGNEEPQNQPSPPPPRNLQTTVLPLTLDYRTLGKVTSVKDQGGCGSCWAFAAAAAYESAHLIQTGTNFDFSEQYAVDCLFPDPLQRCSGGYPGSALSLYNSTGAPPETQYPYYAGTIFNTTLYPNYIGAGMCSATSGYTKLRDLAYMNTFRDNMAETELLTQLVNYGPIVVGVVGAYSSFQNNRNFPYQINDCPSNIRVDHAVLLVGYTETHYIIKNSWGSDWWGEQGYGYISRASDCGIKSYVVQFRTGAAPPPPPPPPTPTYVNVTISMTDTAANGWGYTFGLRQNGVVRRNFTLSTGGSATLTLSNFLLAGVNVDVVVLAASKPSNSNQIGFVIRQTATGSIRFTRSSGTTISSTIGTVIGTFCPTLNTACPTASSQNALLSSSSSPDQGYEELMQSNLQSQQNGSGLSNLEVAMISVTSALSVLVLVLVLIACYFYRQNKQKIRSREYTTDHSISSQSVVLKDMKQIK